MRVLTCSNCGGRCTYGTTRVFRKLIFHFCANCWSTKKPECVDAMAKVGATTEKQKEAA